MCLNNNGFSLYTVQNVYNDMYNTCRTPTNRKNANTYNVIQYERIYTRGRRFNLGVYTYSHFSHFILVNWFARCNVIYSCRLFLVFPSTVPQQLLQLAIVFPIQPSMTRQRFCTDRTS